MDLLVRAHDGRVSVESVVGKGSRFSIHLPVAASRTPRAETPTV